jgi:nucleotide-binding universal stress UspA family protein
MNEITSKITDKKPFVIVVGLDYSDHSDAALTRAFELSTLETAAEVHVVAVHPRLEPARPNGPKSALLDLEIAAAQLQRYVASRWAAFSGAWKSHWQQPPRRVVSHIRCDQPANGIVQLASDLNADLVVVGTHGRHGLTRFLLGSVSQRVLRSATCPVLVMRPKLVLTEDPLIEAPCARCREMRELSPTELWCEEHRSKHGRSHTYHRNDGLTDEGQSAL